MNGSICLYLHKVTGEQKYLDECNRLYKFITNRPTDHDGGIPYRSSSDDIFIDSIGMICPFLAEYGKLTGDNDATNIAIRQLKNFIKYGFDRSSNLPYHGYNLDYNIKCGIIGWGRGLGWFLIGLTGVLINLDKTHKDYQYLHDVLISTISTVMSYQDETGGFHWQLHCLDEPLDSSATSMILYAASNCLNDGIIPKKYQTHISLGMKYLCSQACNKGVFSCSAECGGFSKYPQEYNSYPWSIGPTLAVLSIKNRQP
jgi:rhamnogalacturonyl hydrolase YesR